MLKLRYAIVLLLLGPWVGPAVAEQADNETKAPKTPPVYYQLVLDKAMYRGDTPGDPRELVMDLVQYGDDWGAVYAVSRNFNMPFHKGAVHEASVKNDEITLRVSTVITPDKWIKGGQGSYTIELKRDGRRLGGTFTGQYNDKKVSGTATGEVYAPQRSKDRRPLQPQEHPRILFRKHELPALKAKMNTPFGKAAINRMKEAGTPTALGMLYQLTGDKEWARKAEKEAELYLSGKKPSADPFVPKKPLWAQLEETALVYDLCYDALSEDFKRRYRAYLANFAFQAYFAPESLGTTNWHVVSNHVANVYSGLTHGALAVFDEPAPKPEPPSQPFLQETVPPDKDFTPAKGVPVVKLTPGQSPTEWLHTKPMFQATPDDPREVFYGLEDLRPKPGDTLHVGDFSLELKKMNEKFRSDDKIGGLEIDSVLSPHANAKAQLDKPFTIVLYTVIKVDKPGKYTIFNPTSRANLSQLALAGKLLSHGQVVKLKPGYYPLMAMAQWRMKWGHFAPGIWPYKEGAEKAWAKQAEKLKGKYETRKSAYDTVLATWKRTGGGNPAFTRLMRLARFTSYLHCTDAVGRGGFQAEVGHYSLDAMSGHAKLWPAYRRVMGYDLAPDFQYPDYIPRKLVGGPQDINGTTAIPNRFFAALFPSVREQWKTDVLKAWQVWQKVDNTELPVEVLAEDPVRAFISYPLDMKPTPIGTNLPRVWKAPDLGYYAIRSGWGEDTFIAQVFLKSQIISGWNGANAGTYRLRGLGQNWATGTSSRVRNRQNENVVWLPEGGLNDGGRAFLTHLAMDEKARTMVLSADLDEIYSRKGRYWYSKYGHLRFPVVSVPKGEKIPPPSNITGKRSLAFDFSGISGAPCLFALVDQIDGGDEYTRQWLFQPPKPEGKAKKGENLLKQIVTTRDDGFAIAPEKTDATLDGTFAYPRKVNVDTDPMIREIIKKWGKAQGTKLKFVIDAVRVPGEDHFFFVGTIVPKGQTHPDVKVSGKGLSATVTVGRRTVRFNGKNLVLDKK